MMIYSNREVQEQKTHLIKRSGSGVLNEWEEKFLLDNLYLEVKEMTQAQKSTFSKIYLRVQWK